MILFAFLSGFLQGFGWFIAVKLSMRMYDSQPVYGNASGI